MLKFRSIIIASLLPLFAVMSIIASTGISTDTTEKRGAFLLDIGGSFDYTTGAMESVFGYGGEGYFCLGVGSGKLLYDLGLLIGNCSMNADTFKRSVTVEDQFGNVSSEEISGTVFGVTFGLRKYFFPKRSPANRLFYSGGVGCIYEKRWESPGGEQVEGYKPDHRRGVGLYAKGTIEVNGLPSDAHTAPGIGLYFLAADVFTFGKGYSQIIENDRKWITVQDVRLSFGILVSIVGR